MKTPFKRLPLALLVTAGISAPFSQAAELPYMLPSVMLPYAIQYDDFSSFSMPVLNYFTQADNSVGLVPGPYGTTIQPSEPWYIKSAPGELGMDGEYIVIATGTNNAGVNSNADISNLIDPAYQTPSGGSSNSLDFSTVTADPNLTGVADPGGISGEANFNDLEDSWDINVGTLLDFLGAETQMVVMFNHNELNSDDEPFGSQALLAWAKVWITDNDGNDSGLGPFYLRANETGGADNPNADDWVLAAGDVCLDPDTFIPDPGCNNDPDNDDIYFSHNLGADNAAYGVVSSSLDEAMRNLVNPENYTLHADIRLDDEDDGYEQAFIMAARVITPDEPPPVPTPGILALFGLGLLSMRWSRRK
ncbi:hypothetical protein [Zooshikella sp. RANM57]|uniref:hypothetical protein n=1 Tax=Zooshikella sp. RANM57 TaxID=3425863 RepID=UPI003D6FAA5B